MKIPPYMLKSFPKYCQSFLDAVYNRFDTIPASDTDRLTDCSDCLFIRLRLCVSDVYPISISCCRHADAVGFFLSTTDNGDMTSKSSRRRYNSQISCSFFLHSPMQRDATAGCGTETENRSQQQMIHQSTWATRSVGETC